MNSEKIAALLKNFKITIPLGVVVGLILGMVIGWGIWPVQWTDLAPYHLRQDLREDYLRMSIFTSTTTGNASVATKAWDELEDTAADTLAAVKMDSRYLTNEQITSFELVVGAGDVDVDPAVEEPVIPDVVDEGSGPNWLFLGLLCLVVIVASVAVIYFLLIRKRSTGEGGPETLSSRSYSDDDVGFEEDEMRYASASQDAYQTPEQDEPHLPVAQFMTTFMLGDDLYDDSFSIDAPTGEFLGECGIGISETVGVGDPKRVTAFEVWLFDKNDIQTVTKVIMSVHAYDDDKLRLRLDSKGEPVLAEPGKQVLLETATLQLEARIVDMEYGEGAAPDESFFQRLTLEMAVWPKERAEF